MAASAESLSRVPELAPRQGLEKLATYPFVVLTWVDDDGYPLNLTQVDLAECLGLTSVHINRTLKELRERRLVEFRGGRVSIHDLAGLERVAEFDPAYLHLERRGR